MKIIVNGDEFEANLVTIINAKGQILEVDEDNIIAKIDEKDEGNLIEVNALMKEEENG